MTIIDNSPANRFFPNFLAGTLLGIGLLFLAGVLERWAAATWMAYKFSGFSSKGFVTLSADTARIYIPTAVMLLVLSYSNMLFSRKRQIRVASSMSNYAAMAFVMAIVLYVALGFSPLNQWRA